MLLTHGPGIDQPLSVIRMNYGDHVNLGYRRWPAFAVIPIWNSRGKAPYVTFGNGSRELASPEDASRKLGTYWLLAKEAHGPANNALVTASSGGWEVWLGGVMKDQQDASGLLHRRNRYYDPASGRFTQEDPIGLAGGLNVYGFAAGDPVSYSDPYGLKVCFNGTRSEREQLRRETESAVGARIDVGADGCVTSVGNSSSAARGQFNALVESKFTYSIAYGTGGSWFNPLTRSIWLDPLDIFRPFHGMEDGYCVPAFDRLRFIARALAHELGHAYDAERRFGRLRDFLGGQRRSERRALAWENLWARQNNQPERCRYGADF